MPPANALEEQLAEARTRRSKTRRQIVVVGGAAVAALVLVAGAAYLVAELQRARGQLEGLGGDAPGTVAPAVTVESGVDGGTVAAAPAVDSSVADAAPAVDSTVADNTVADSTVAADSGGLRAEFMRRLAEYEAAEAQVDALNLRDWDAARAAQLEELKMRAVEQFAAGEYAQAGDTLRQAGAAAAAAVAAHARELAAAKQAARAAFAAGRATEAADAVRRALQLAPGDAEMRALQKRVSALAEVSAWLARAAVARAENRPAKEAAALQKVLELDRARVDARSRLQELRAQFAQEKFAAAVGGAQEALAAGELATAARQIQAAQAVFPAHEALAPLQAALQAARAEREFAAVMTLGAQAGRQDDWPAAVAHFGRARQIKPNDSAAVAGLNRAQEVVGAARKIAGFLAAPQRLADRHVVDAAAAVLRETESIAAASPRLRAQRGELAAVVGAYLTTVEVVVLSDNAANIELRGVEHYGKTKRRVISLRPGAHVFECKRRGYKSKRVPLDIPPGAAGPFEVTVICDEKI